MRLDGKATGLRRLGADISGVAAVEYALFAALVVLSIVTALRFIGADAMLGLPPIIDVMETAAP